MDFAIRHRKALIASAITPATVEDVEKRLAANLAAKRIRAINTLGSKWVLHPGYNASRCAHHNPSFKSSAVLAVFLAATGGREMGRV